MKKLDRAADTTGKRTWGRVVVEEDGSLTFYVAADAHTKAPAVLREALKSLPDRAELKGVRLDALRRATCRLDEAEALGQKVVLDTAELKGTVEKQSVLGRLFRSDSAKLLSRLVAWNDRYGGALTASNVRAAQRELDDLRQRCRAWAESRTDDAGKRQAERLKNEVQRARNLLDGFQQEVRQDAEADRTADALLQGQTLGTDEAAAGPLKNAAEKLAGRLTLDLDPEERAFVERKLGAVAERCRVGVSNLDQRLTGAPTPTLYEARRGLRLGLAADLGARLRGVDGELPEALRTEALGLVNGLCDDIRHSTKSDQVSPLGRAILDTATTLDERGGDGGPLLEKLADIGVELTGREYRAARGVLGNLGRSNSLASAVRAMLTQHLGDDYANHVLDGPRRLLAVQPNLGPRTLTEETDPGVPARFDRLEAIQKAIKDTVHDAREQLVDAALLLLGLPASHRTAALGVAHNPSEVRTGRRDGLGPAPTARALARELVMKDATIRQALVGLLAERAEPFLATRITLDPDPRGTATLLRTHLELRVQEGATDLDEALLGFNPPHWDRAELSPETLRGMLEDGGHLSPPLDEEQQSLVEDADSRAQGRYDAANQVSATQLVGLMAETLDAAPSLRAVLEGFRSMMEAILEDPEAIPAEIRSYARRVLAEARAAGLGDEGDRLVLADLLMLRWINPSLVGSTPVATAVSISALLQSVANHQTPLDHRLLPFVPAIEEYTDRFDTFLGDLLRLLERDAEGDGRDD